MENQGLHSQNPENVNQITQTTIPQESPKSRKGLIIKLIILSLLLILPVIGFLVGQKSSNSKALDKENTIKETATNVKPQLTETPIIESKIPSDWSYKSSNNCNIEIALPPNNAKYNVPMQNGPAKSLDLDKDAYWMFKDESGTGDGLFNKVVFAIYDSPRNPGSGYAAGMIRIDCNVNLKNYTTETLVDAYDKEFISNQNSSGELSIIKKETINLWGKQVLAVYFRGGMYNENEPYYFLATKEHAYMIYKVAMSTNPLIKTVTDQIFESLVFKD